LYKDAPLHIWTGVKKTNPVGRGAVAAPIVIEVPPELKSLAKPLLALVAGAGKLVKAGRGGQAIDYAAIERELAAMTNDVERAAHQDILVSIEIDAPRIRAGGKTYVKVGQEEGSYYTMTGPITLDRALYREVGVRNGKTIDVISLRTGAIGHGWLPETAQAMAFLVQQVTPREAAASAKKLGRLPYSRPSFDRVTHAVGEHWESVHVDIEDQLITALEIPAETRSVSVAVDRVAVPMEEPAPRPVGRPRKDAPKNPITRPFRMAYVGALTLHDGRGKSVHSIRYGCMPAGDPTLLCTGMANDLYRLLQARPGLQLVRLADGAHEMWNLLEGEDFAPEVLGTFVDLVDFWHLIEKLAPAAKVLHGEGPHRTTLRRWRIALRRRSSGAAEILAELRASNREHVVVNNQQPVHEAITYIENHGHRMNYAAARRKHLPIGSGNAEATCKTLFQVRFKRAGSRWKHATGEHIVKFRALALSDRWDDAMTLFHETRRCSVRRAA
jgi:hypothetical protein